MMNGESLFDSHRFLQSLCVEEKRAQLHNKKLPENHQVYRTESRVKMLQAAWPTGDGVLPGTIDRNDRTKGIIREIAQSPVFLAATICLSIVALLCISLTVLSPFAWMAVGLWIIYAQARRNKGEIRQLGFSLLVIGQYINFAIGVLAAFFSFCMLVEGCTDLGKQYTDFREILFWGSGLLMTITFLLAGFRWKIVCAVKAIRDANDGNANDNRALPGAIAECFAVGVVSCLTVIGIVQGIMAILFGCVLVCYYKKISKLEEEIWEQELLKEERREIVPTWKIINENR